MYDKVQQHALYYCNVGHDDIVSVFPDSILELHTTRSWDFIQEVAVESVLGRRYQPRPTTRSSDDVIIGMIDTGSFRCSFFFLLLYIFLINFLCMLEEQKLDIFK